MAYISFQPNDYFSTKLYTGNGSTNAQTGVGFKPDMCWWKMRSGTEEHALGDAVRTAGYIVKPNSSDAQAQSASYFASFDSDGFTLGSDTKTNGNGSTYASWNWRASNTTAVSNTDGSITSTVSASTASGFSIVKYTGTGSNATVGHSLGVAPQTVWIKKLTSGGGNEGFYTYWKAIGAGNQMTLAGNDASSSGGSLFNSTDPTSSVFSVGTHNSTNYSGGEYIAYCFTPIKGFSAINSYSGNGNADGVYQHLGFSASWIMIKRTDSTASWVIFDNKRLGYNVANYQLYANSTSAEGNNVLLDITSQGFKCRANHLDVNGSGASYIYMAFAEAPLVSSNGVPAVAR